MNIYEIKLKDGQQLYGGSTNEIRKESHNILKTYPDLKKVREVFSGLVYPRFMIRWFASKYRP